MSTSPIPEATLAVHGILDPLTSDERQKVVRAAMIMLGEQDTIPNLKGAKGKPDTDASSDDEQDNTGLPVQAQRWMKKNSLALDHIEHFFHISDGKAEVIELPSTAKSRQEKAITVYLFQGVAAFLTNGDPSFSDEVARKSCEHFGCYDMTNHSKVFKSFGNTIVGSKSSGWKLTAPGLTAAVTYLKNGKEDK